MQATEAGGAPRIVVIGSTMIDQVAYVPRAPDAGETLVGDRFQTGFGGKGANQAVMARLLGADVWMVNCVGDDLYGGGVVDNLAGFGIDTSHMRVVAGSTGVAPIWVEPDGTNRIVVVPGANLAVTAEHAAEAVRAIGEVDVVVGQFEIPLEATAAGFEAARRTGAVTVLNPAPVASLERDLLEATDWLVPNEVEFALLSEGGSAFDDDDLRAYSQAVDTRLLVTLGEQGLALVRSDGTVVRRPTLSVRAVDTTGAGDAFVGGFAVGLAISRSEGAACELGIRCASDSVTREGTQTSFPRPDRCREFLADTHRPSQPAPR